MIRPIAISLSPNVEIDDVWEAVKALLSPVRWFSLAEVRGLEADLGDYLGKGFQVAAVNSGRSALYLALQAMGIGEGDEVAMQVLTCVAVPNAITWNRAKPVYVDVDENLNIDPKDLAKKVTKKTKAVIVQHSFGMPAQMEAIKRIAKKYKLAVIEDCALSLGANYKGKKVGTLGDVAIFSFGRDKVLSSVFGGAAVTKNKALYGKIKVLRDNVGNPHFLWVAQQLIHPLLFSLVILPLYNLGVGKLTLGKVLLFTLQKVGILSKPVYPVEKTGGQPQIFPEKIAGILARLARHQLTKLDEFNTHRKAIAGIYFKELKHKDVKLPQQDKGAIWVRFPVISKKANEIFTYAKNKGILLGNWYSELIVPAKHVDLLFYEDGLCPQAERLAGNILNLPTYPTLSEKDAHRLVTLIKSCLNIQTAK